MAPQGRSLVLKQWTPWLLFFVMFGVALAVASALYRLENAQHQTHFILAASKQVAVLEAGIHTRFRPVQHLATVFGLQEGALDERSFLLFVRSIPATQSPALVALQWFPRRETDRQRETFPAGYSYSQSEDPLSELENDWREVPNRIVDLARGKPELFVTPWYVRDDQVLLRAVRPVFGLEVDEPELLGFVSGLYRVDRLITEALCSPLGTDVINVFVVDAHSDVGDPFHCSGENARAVRFDTDIPQSGRRLTWSIPVNGATWIATAIAAPGAFTASRWIPFVIGFAGLILGGILALFHRAMISREAQVHQLVKRRTKQLEAMNSELEQFAYVASHDLKAPLRAVSQLSSSIMEDTAERLDEGSRDRLRLMRERVIRMDRLIEGLLAYSRAGRVTSEVAEPVPLKSLLEELSSELSLPAGFRVEIQDPLPNLLADALHLKQIFQNLITNAASHHDRPESGKVRIRAEEEKRFWRIEIADNGPGIPAEERERIFGMFTSLEAETGKGHAGIGLTIVRKLVLSYGGKIDVIDNRPHGARFRIWWPKPTNY